MGRAAVTFLVVFAVGLGLTICAGCESDAGTGSAIGALAGAGIGQLAGGDTESTLIGAAVGGGAGYMLGNEQDKKKTQQEMADLRAEQNTITIWITNSNGSQTPVKLRKEGPGYVGPRGERYSSLPTKEQLQKVYGF